MLATFTHLIGAQKGERAEFSAGKITVGRAPDNMLCLGDGARRVSSHHAEVVRRGDGYVLRDLGSTNGTMINGRRVVISELAPDDLIEVGAGGPLLRFGVEGGEQHADNQVAGLERDGATSSSASRTRAAGGRNNAALITALAAALLLGGAGGIIGSSRLRSADALSFAEIAEMSTPAVVFVRTEFELLDASGQVTTTEARTGSGFVISQSGLVVTNRHLVRDWEYSASAAGATGRITRIEVIFPHQARERSVQAEVYKLGPDNSADVAVLKIKSSGAPFINRFEQGINETNQGDEVVVIGYPLGLDLFERTNDATIDPSLSTGIVSRVGHDFIQLSLRAYRGNSGGPVLNRKGAVMGILTANVSGAQDLALCTPIGAALALVGNELRD